MFFQGFTYCSLFSVLNRVGVDRLEKASKVKHLVHFEISFEDVNFVSCLLLLEILPNIRVGWADMTTFL